MGMKLIRVGGPAAGTAVDIYPPGISIGREQDNDIVIDDSLASRYHAKIELYDQVWFIHDLNSRNGVVVNGKRIESHAPLSLHDEIRIGTSDFVFSDGTMPAHLSGGAAAAASTAGTANAAAPATSRNRRVLVLALVFVLLLLLVAAGIVLQLPSRGRPAAPPPDAGDPPVAEKANDLQIYYEKLIASKGNVFRYELELKDGLLAVAMDDVRNDWHVTVEPKSLPPEQLALIANRLLQPEFLALQSPTPGAAGEQHQRERLLIRARNQGNYVEVVNGIVPGGFRDAVSQLTALAAKEFYIPEDSVPKDEVINSARKEFLVAKDLLARQDMGSPNLYDAVNAFHRVQERLRWIDPKPDFFREAHDLEVQAAQALDDKIKEQMRAANLEARVNRLDEARAKYQVVVDMLPDTRDPRYREARNAILDLNAKIEDLRKRR